MARPHPGPARRHVGDARGTTGRPGPDPSPATAPLSREDAWRADLAFFAREFAAAQRDFATLYPRGAFDTELAAITRDLPATTDTDIVLRLMRLVASGRVAHTTVRIPSAPSPVAFHRLPLGFAWFSDGLAITVASEPHRELLGLRVVAIGRMTPAALEQAIAPYVSREHDVWLRQQSQSMMTITELLRVVGQADADGRVSITTARPDGSTTTMQVESIPSQNGPPLVGVLNALGITRPLFARQPDRYYWFELLPEQKALYIQYRRCAEDPQQPFAAFAQALFAAVDANPAAVERVVVDLRLNTGGDSRVITPLLDGLRERKSLSGKGRLYGVIGPATFSSGLMAAMALRNELNAVLVGEPSGEKPNSYGEVRLLTLPHSKVVVQYLDQVLPPGQRRPAHVQPGRARRPVHRRPARRARSGAGNRPHPRAPTPLTGRRNAGAHEPSAAGQGPPASGGDFRVNSG